MIKVVRGNPTPEELAAALAVVQARAAATAAAAAADGGPKGPEGWSDPARVAAGVRHRPGPRTWARSYWPA